MAKAIAAPGKNPVGALSFSACETRKEVLRKCSELYFSNELLTGKYAPYLVDKTGLPLNDKWKVDCGEKVIGVAIVKKRHVPSGKVHHTHE